MCLLALFFRYVDDAPVVVGANREEAYARGGTPPQILEGRCRAVAGVDPTAGGTWLGVNQHRVLVAVTNRFKTEVPARPRSRGLLTRMLLECTSAREAAAEGARELDGKQYAGCNLLCVDPENAYVLHAGDWLRVRPLSPGLYVLTAQDVNDVGDPRVAHALFWLGRTRYLTGADCMGALEELCKQTGDGEPAMCLRGPLGGTVSSSIVALRAGRGACSFHHAQGPPDQTPYVDCSLLLSDILNR
jgi:hypothetical protein